MEIAVLDSVAIHYRLQGPKDGPVLVFSNSLGTDFRIWDEVINRLSKYRILTYDKRGHGLSDCPSGEWGMGDNVADLARLMDHLGLANVVVCGLSVGGLIAQGLAAERPDLVRAMVLCDTAAKIGNPDMWSSRIKAVQEDGIASIADGILERWFSPDFIKNSPRFSVYKNMLIRTLDEGYWKMSFAISETDLLESTARLKLPAMAMVGVHDGATPPDLVRETADLIEGCRFELIKAAGHLPCVEQPDVVADLLLEFMAEHGHV